MSDQKTDTQNAWLSPEDIAQVRNQVPIIYVDAVPVRVNPDGDQLDHGDCLGNGGKGLFGRTRVIAPGIAADRPQHPGPGVRREFAGHAKSVGGGCGGQKGGGH